MADSDNLLQIGSRDRLSQADDLMWNFMRQLSELTGVREIFAEASQGLDLHLTPGAMLMLIIPLIEAARLQVNFSDIYKMLPPASLSVSRESATSSLSQVLHEVQQSPAEADRLLQQYFKAQGYPFATSLSVIKAFWRRFCGIPPFCSEPKRQ